MSGSKRLLEEIQEERAWAVQLLLDAGALAECENHGYLTDELDSAALDDAVAAGMRSSGDSEAKVKRRLQDVLDEYGEECPGCVKNAAD
ncbi:hypothetical protein [Pseudooceanicola marinus]|uniref:hypothetical protein n=1 Tax=Pseudooceanicola marinus TaxID=396013 RepID=UPI001CD63775|nr:hypothetical protein [Pseudooceanicola marinus]MCA1336888.1 hypothetical protein [Pseudooceanicola marinus]